MKKGNSKNVLIKDKYTFSWGDMSLIKLAVFCFALFIVSLFEQDILDKIKGLKMLWLLLTIIFMIKPLVKVWGKK